MTEVAHTWPVVGHDWAVRQMQLALAHDEVPHALLFTGPESVGKLTLAQTVAAALLCKGAKDQRPCGTCLSCRKLNSGNHPDFLLVAPEGKGKRLKIDQIRALERFLSLTPNESPHKIALVTHFERATIGAANALLKTLEEPPAYANLMLLAEDAELLLPTIVSRSQQVNLRPLARQVVGQALQTRWHVAPELAERLARISGGRLGWAVRAVTEPEYHERMEAAVTGLLDILKQDLPTRFSTAQELARNSEHLAETLAYWIVVWRDILLIHTENVPQLTFREHQPALSDIATQVDLSITLQVIQRLESTQTALQRNANTQLLIENLLLNFPTPHAT